MAAPAALNVVKQIQQALADGPEKGEIGEYLGQMVGSLQFFLDHPDSLVRVQAARTLLKLARGSPAEVQPLDLSRARSSLTRLSDSITKGESVDEGAEEVREALASLFETIEPTRRQGPAAAGGGASTTEESDGSKRAHARRLDIRGEIVFSAGEAASADDRAAILEEVVSFPGVLSTTFEDTLIIVNTCTRALATDAKFVDGLLSTLQAHGLQRVSVTRQAAPLPEPSGGAVPPIAAALPAADETESNVDAVEPTYLDDDLVEEMSRSGVSSPRRGGSTPRTRCATSLEAGGYPGGGSVGPKPASPAFPTGINEDFTQWSFFSQGHWLTGRRAQEFEDDPTVAARLVKAKQREEQRKLEERSRFGRLLSALSLS